VALLRHGGVFIADGSARGFKHPVRPRMVDTTHGRTDRAGRSGVHGVWHGERRWGGAAGDRDGGDRQSWRCVPRPARMRRRHARLGVGAGLSKQSNAQCPACRRARAGRGRAAGALGLPAAGNADGDGRRPESDAFDEDGCGLQRKQLPVHAPYGRRHRDPDAVQRLPDRQPHASGRGTGLGGPRDARGHRGEYPAAGGDRLYEPAARRRHPRPPAPQRRGAAGAAAPDPRPLQCRRGDAHRRGAGRISPRRRPLAGAHGGVELRLVEGDLSSDHRGRARQARRRNAGRPAIAAHPHPGHRDRPRVQSQCRGRDVRHRHRAASGQDQRRRVACRP